MHEMTLCRGIRDVITDHACRHAVTRVTRVRIALGCFSCVSKEALLFAFDVVMRGSVAEGAELVVRDLPGKALCYDCEVEVALQDRLARCPLCGGGTLMPTAGDEMRIEDMEAA